MILNDFFNADTLFRPDGSGLLQQNNPLLWQFRGEQIDLRNTKALLDVMQRYYNKADYRAVKFINSIVSSIDAYEKKDRVDHFPAMYQIEHTDICNARCIMCNHSFTHNHGCKFMDMSIIHELEPLFPYANYVVLNGIGEPLLHPQIKELMEIYGKYGIRLSTNTNMSVMDEEIATLMQKTFYDIQISCDAADAETYERIRRGLNFEKFKRNALMLRNAGDVEICMATVVMRQNVTQLPQIVELAASLGCAKVILLDLNTSRLLHNIEDCARNFPATACYYMDRAKETGERLGVIVHTLDYTYGMKQSSVEEADIIKKEPVFQPDSMYEELYKMYESIQFFNPVFDARDTDYCTASKFRSIGYCQFIENRPFISATGDVFNCCTRRMHSMGNITKCSFADVWNGEPMQQIRHIFNLGYLPKYCTGCTYLRSGLMVDRIVVTEYDDSFYEDLYDEYRINLINEKRRSI